MRRNAHSRRALLRAAAGVGIGALAGCSVATGRRGPETSADLSDGAWTSQLDNPANTGFDPAVRGPDPPVSPRWQVDVPVASSPVAAGDTVFVVSTRGTVYALSPGDGHVRWRVETGAETQWLSPAVAGDTVYVATVDGYVRALSVADGAERWQVPVNVGPDGGDRSSARLGTAPTVVDGTVYVGSTEPTNALHALSTDDGAEQWRVPFGGPVYGTPAVVDGVVYAGDQSGSSARDATFAALAATDGSPLWRVDLERGASAPPVVSDGTVFVGGQSRTLYAFRVHDGAERWRVQLETDRGGGGFLAGIGSVAVSDGTVYADDGYGKLLHALAVSDGAEQWQFRADGDLVRSARAVAGDTVYVGSDAGTLFALSTDDGRVRWQFAPQGPPSTADADDGTYTVRSDPAVVGGTIVVGAEYWTPERAPGPLPGRLSALA